MIDVAHNGDNRRSGSQILLAVCEVFDSFFRFLFFDLADDDLFAQFVTEDLDGIFIQILIDEIDLPIIVDAGIGRPSQACEAMEMGASAVMANTAVATAGDVALMAEAFKKAIEAGRSAYLAGLGRTLERGASASSPLTGFLQEQEA